MEGASAQSVHFQELKDVLRHNNDTACHGLSAVPYSGLVESVLMLLALMVLKRW